MVQNAEQAASDDQQQVHRVCLSVCVWLVAHERTRNDGNNNKNENRGT